MATTHDRLGYDRCVLRRKLPYLVGLEKIEPTAAKPCLSVAASYRCSRWFGPIDAQAQPAKQTPQSSRGPLHVPRATGSQIVRWLPAERALFLAALEARLASAG